VRTETEVSEAGMVVVVVPPWEVTTCDTTGELASGMVTVWEHSSDGTNEEVGTPDSVITGALQEVAGV
jgi:hypothetical protein